MFPICYLFSLPHFSRSVAKNFPVESRGGGHSALACYATDNLIPNEMRALLKWSWKVQNGYFCKQVWYQNVYELLTFANNIYTN